MSPERHKAFLPGVETLDRYLKELSTSIEDFLVVIAAKGAIGKSFPASAQRAARKLGLKVDFRAHSGSSYACIIHRGTVLHEQISKTDEDVSVTATVDSRRISLFSSVPKHANAARIVVDGWDYAIGTRGLNIAVFDADTGQLRDSVGFDTHAKVVPCYRDDARSRREIASLHREISSLSKQLSQLQNQLADVAEFNRVDSARTQLMLWHSMSAARQKSDEEGKLDFFRSLPPARGALRKQQLAQFIQLCELDRVCAERGAKYWRCFGGLLGAVRAGRLIPWDDDLDVAMMREDLELIVDAFDDNPDFTFGTLIGLRGNSVTKVYKIAFRNRGGAGSLDIFVMDFVTAPQHEVVPAMLEENIKMRDDARALAAKQYGSCPKAPFALRDPKYDAIVDEHVKAFQQKYSLGAGHEQRSSIFWGIENVTGRTARRAYFSYDSIFPLGTISLEGREFLAPADPIAVVTQLYGDYLSIPDDMFSHRHLEPDLNQVHRLDLVLDKHRAMIAGIIDPDGHVIEA